MTTVITYGTYDLLHHGHIRLLERARRLGDHLIVGVTASDFDKARGKINVQQSLLERVEAVRSTGLADEVIVEEYDGQKIDDIVRLGVDIFAVGSDWKGYFDYLSEYCQVIYLDRTEGVSSTQVRRDAARLSFGFIGDSPLVLKYLEAAKSVNAIQVEGVFSSSLDIRRQMSDQSVELFDDLEGLLRSVDAVYVASHPSHRESDVREALLAGVHVLCESPVASSAAGFDELIGLADNVGVVLRESIKTAYSTGYHRLRLLLKSGRIGSIVAVNATCTSLSSLSLELCNSTTSSFYAWAPVAMLPVFHFLGTDFIDFQVCSRMVEGVAGFDAFSKIDFLYEGAVASVLVGKGIKSEGQLIVSGTNGYAYVPAPWWKTEYFEIRRENPANDRRYFYQGDSEGIRDQFIHLARLIEVGSDDLRLDRSTSRTIATVVDRFNSGVGGGLTVLGKSFPLGGV